MSHGRPFSDLVDLVGYRAGDTPDKIAFRYLEDGESRESVITCRELDLRARALAVRLRQVARPGDRMVLLSPPCLDYLVGFFGCLHGGFIAVPVYPPDPDRLAHTLPRLQAIIRDSQSTVVLTTSGMLALAQSLLPLAPELKAATWIATDEVGVELASEWTRPPITPDTVAFLQYTSGSTGMPKGVMLSHGTLLANQLQIGSSMRTSAELNGFSWLPIYHDMGLIGQILHPFWQGFGSCTFMSPIHFLVSPMRWLRGISRYRAGLSGAPNFGFDLCVRKVKPEDLATLDLSCWEVAYNGAERVRPETLRAFARTFAPCGFQEKALFPCYGLAEATLMVSGHRCERPEIERVAAAALEEDGRAEVASDPAQPAREYVSCGRPVAGTRLLVVDPETATPRAEGEGGEIWLSGPSIALGYWGRPEENERVFGARLAGEPEGKFLRTGDLGYLRGGRLFVTGRFKDLVIVRGKKFHPEDIERAIERSHRALRPGCTIAFAVDGEAGEGLVIVSEVDKGYRPERPGEIQVAVCESLASHFQLRAEDVVLIRPGTVPKTSSGKLQRRACREQYLARKLAFANPA